MVQNVTHTADSNALFTREESSRRRRKERGRKLRRYFLIGLATVGGGTLIGDYPSIVHAVYHVAIAELEPSHGERWGVQCRDHLSIKPLSKTNKTLPLINARSLLQLSKLMSLTTAWGNSCFLSTLNALTNSSNALMNHEVDWFLVCHLFLHPCLSGVTGGLAAPLVAAGAGAVLGAGGAAALGSATGIAIMASLFGAAGAGLTGG